MNENDRGYCLHANNGYKSFEISMKTPSIPEMVMNKIIELTARIQRRSWCVCGR
jgi:hypothetical protein